MERGEGEEGKVSLLSLPPPPLFASLLPLQAKIE